MCALIKIFPLFRDSENIEIISCCANTVEFIVRQLLL